MPWQDSSPASFLAATCPKRAWEGEEPFPFFCVFWIAISKNSLYFGFGLWRLHKLLLFVVFLICSFHTSVREIVGTNRTSETQDFMQMKSPHWVCGRDRATCSTRKRQTMEWRRTGSGIKSVRSWIREISRSDLSQTPPTSQKPGSVRRKWKKKKSGSDLAQAGAVLLHSHKVSVLLWIRHVNGMSQWAGNSAQNSEKAQPHKRVICNSKGKAIY